LPGGKKTKRSEGGEGTRPYTSWEKQDGPRKRKKNFLRRGSWKKSKEGREEKQASREPRGLYGEGKKIICKTRGRFLNDGERGNSKTWGGRIGSSAREA